MRTSLFPAGRVDAAELGQGDLPRRDDEAAPRAGRLAEEHIALDSCWATLSCRRDSARAGLAPGPTRTARGWGRLSSSCSTPPSVSSFPCCCASDLWP